jgi:hypothetical protein
MVKIKIGATVSFYDEFEIETDDYEEYKTATVREVIAHEKSTITEMPEFVMEHGEMTVDVEVIK